MKRLTILQIICLVNAVVLTLAFFGHKLGLGGGFYSFVQFFTMIISAILGGYFYKKNQIIWAIVSFVVALLFQPFFKIGLGVHIWGIVDIVVAVALLLGIITKEIK